MLARHEKDWTDELVGPLRELLGTDVFEYDFRSGFVEALTLPAPLFLRHAQALFERVPLRRLRLLGAGPHLGDLARAPALGRLSGLELDGPGLNESPRRVSPGFRRLAASPHLAGLVRLGLYNANLGRDHLELLLDSPHLTGLEALLLGGNSLFGGGATVPLARSPLTARLVTLDLAATGLHDSGLLALVRAGLPRLAQWNVSDNGGVGNASLHALTASPHSKALTLLDLVGTGVTASGVGLLAASANLAGLRRLFVGPVVGAAAAEWRAAKERLGDRLIFAAHSWHEERLT